MHARTTDFQPFAPVRTAPPLVTRKPLVPVQKIRAGEHFIRTDSPGEVLVIMTWAGGGFMDESHSYAVVVATNDDSEGYVVGQLLRLRNSTLVRVVHQARAPVFALEV